MYANANCVTGLFEAAARAAENLAYLLDAAADAAEVAAGFDELTAGLEALPPDPATDMYLRNTAGDAAALHAAGEPGAARWQAVQLARRLRRLRDAWAADTVPVGRKRRRA